MTCFLLQNKVKFVVSVKRPFSRKIYYPRTTTQKNHQNCSKYETNNINTMSRENFKNSHRIFDEWNWISDCTQWNLLIETIRNEKCVLSYNQFRPTRPEFRIRNLYRVTQKVISFFIIFPLIQYWFINLKIKLKIIK